jgi:hypothetical protein
VEALDAPMAADRLCGALGGEAGGGDEISRVLSGLALAPSGGRRGRPGDRRPRARRQAERSTSTGADRRCDRSQSGPEAHAAFGRRRLLLRRQPSGAGGTRRRRPHRAGAGQTRERGKRRRGAGRRHARRSRPAATSVPIGCASNCPSRCSDRSSKRAASASSYCAGSRKSPPNGPSSASPTMF